MGRCCFLLRNRQSRKTNSNKSSNAPAATDIPIMAAVESFLDFLWGGLGGGWNAGEGAGEGKNGLHGGNGPPQRSMLPAKEEAGNFCRVAGIEPLRRLLETLNCTRGALMLGRVPVKALSSRNRPVKRAKLLTENGIEPVKLL